MLQGWKLFTIWAPKTKVRGPRGPNLNFIAPPSTSITKVASRPKLCTRVGHVTRMKTYYHFGPRNEGRGPQGPISKYEGPAFSLMCHPHVVYAIHFHVVELGILRTRFGHANRAVRGKNLHTPRCMFISLLRTLQLNWLGVHDKRSQVDWQVSYSNPFKSYYMIFFKVKNKNLFCVCVIKNCFWHHLRVRARNS